MALQAGARLGPYEVLSLIGTGGMGEVWLATELRLGRKVALKLLPADLTRDPVRIQRFEQEARAASALNHPNVCTIYALDQTTEGQHYIAMEYVEGETLRRRLVTSRLSVREALDIAIQVAAALSVTDAAGIVHRDIKPENVMLRPDGVVKVLDFGLAKLAPATSEEAQTTKTAVNTDAGTVVGTAAYMSPEQMRGEQLDARTDVFSLGVVLYEMATGVPPFRGKTSAVIFEAILNRTPPAAASLRPDLPAGLDAVISKALEKDRDIRYQSAREVLVDLRRLKRDMDSGPGVAEPHTNVGPARPSLRKRSVVAVITIVALAVLLAAAWLTVKRQAEPTSSQVGLMQPTPLTTLPGLERSPSFSPDGNQIAFSWDGDTGNEDIYVKLVGAGSPLRLTTSSAPDVHPAWSPNGLSIAFVRIAGDEGGIFIIPALGGPERRIDPVKWDVEWDLHGAGLSWSPDGRYLAFSDRSAPQAPVSLFILSVGESVRRRLTSPPALSVGDVDPDLC
jgi:serine/threonine protein kinase